MNRIAGYFNPAATVRPYAAADAPGAAPYGAGQVQAFGVDDYAQAGAELSALAQPVAPGAVAGVNAKTGVARSQRFFEQADRSKRFGSRVKATRAGRRVAASGVVSAIKGSVLVGGLLSIFSNGYSVYQGRQSVAQASGRVIGDVAASAVGGTAAAASSAVGTALLAPSLGTGLGLTLVGVGVGLVSFVAAEALFRQTGIYNRLTASTERMVAQVAE